MGCFTIILMMIVLFIVWGLLIVLQFFHMNFAILLCTFLEKYIGWNNLFWFCILVPILFNIINRIRLRIKKRCWKKELEEVYQNLDSAFFQTPNNFIEFRYARVEIIKYLIEYIQTGRASSYKEALNLFLDNFYPPQPSLHDKYYDPFDSVYYVKSYKQKY